MIQVGLWNLYGCDDNEEKVKLCSYRTYAPNQRILKLSQCYYQSKQGMFP